MVTQLVYTSRPRFNPQDPQGRAILDKIIDAARNRNSQAGISGILLVGDGWLSQVLEGEAPALSPVLRRILADERHEGIQIHQMRMIPERRFADFAMAVAAQPTAEIPVNRLAEMNAEDFIKIAGLSQPI